MTTVGNNPPNSAAEQMKSRLIIFNDSLLPQSDEYNNHIVDRWDDDAELQPD